MRTVLRDAHNERDELTRVLGYVHELKQSGAFAWFLGELALEEAEQARRTASGIEEQYEYWRTVGAVRALQRARKLLPEARDEANMRLAELGVDI